MYWANLLHIYQPPGQKKEIVDKVVSESYDRILGVLESHGRIKISLNICASLTQQLCDFGYQNIVARIKKLAEEGRIELVGSAAYHPILPFLPEREILRQIDLNEEINRKYFGPVWKPQGFFLPEMAYSKRTAKIIRQKGYQWIVLDEIAYQGSIGRAGFDRTYKLNFFFNKNLKVIFRNRGLSATFFTDWLDSIDKFFLAVKKDGRSNEFLITAFDGENLGHHQKHLVDIWTQISLDPRITTVNYSQYLGFLKPEKSIAINPLNSSWATESEDLKNKNFYPLWSDPDNQIHKNFRKITNMVLKTVYKSVNDQNYETARGVLDKALFSDPCWWASARPWWGPGMIELGVDYFSEIVSLLEKEIKPKFRQRIEVLFKEILTLARAENK